MGKLTPTSTETRRGRGVLHSLAVLVSLALVLLAAVAAIVLVQGISGQLTDISRTYEVRNEARELTNALSDAESSRRGYLLTGDDDYVARYEAAAREVEERLLSLTALAKREPAQAEQVRIISVDVITKAAEMTESLRLAQAQGDFAASQPIETGIGERLMEPFIADESRKLEERNRAVAEARRWLLGALITALAAALILGYALFMRAQRQVRELSYSTGLLHSENEILERRVSERTRALEDARAHADVERQRVEALLRDASHRIGNSLATVSSLLGLQLMRSKSDEVRRALESARSRVHAIASAHRRLRLGSDFETASADEFLEAVLEDIAITATDAKAVTVSGDFEPIVVPARDATTIGILVGELVTNALKHAFPEGRQGTIQVSLKRDADGVPVLSVDDDGIGLPQGAAAETGLGSVIVQQLAGQFGGVPFYRPGPAGGLSVSIAMPSIAADPCPPRS